MEPNPLLFRDLTYIFLAAVAGGVLAWRLRLPLILGFVLGGIAISPFTPGPRLFDLHAFEVFADVGVVFLMFSIGFEFSLNDLLRVKWVALLGAPLGIAVIVGVAAVLGKLAGWNTSEALIIGAGVSVASTMAMARLLSDSGRLAEIHGRVMIGITLVEDLAVLCMTVLIPALSGTGEHRLWQALWTLGKTLLLPLPLMLLAIRVIPQALRRVKRTCNPELFLLVAIAICLGTAELAQAAGFSTALGAFLAGISISGLDDLHDTHTQLAPLRDAFVALFFVSLGALIDPRVIFSNLQLLATMLAMIVVVKFAVWGSVVWLFRYSLRTAVVVAAGLTQIGELSFILVQTARSAGLVGGNVFSTLVAASLISILLNVFLLRAAFRWASRNGMISHGQEQKTGSTPASGTAGRQWTTGAG
jgi:monovalent cation:H+ antiporter-2, CPA2 family